MTPRYIEDYSRHPGGGGGVGGGLNWRLHGITQRLTL